MTRPIVINNNNNKENLGRTGSATFICVSYSGFSNRGSNCRDHSRDIFLFNGCVIDGT